MAEDTQIDYPHTAATTWSGYVYQGKVALYHCLKLIEQGNPEFELQLDSTDDFAIYENQVLKTAHQVKAKIGTTRNSYKTALEKCAEIDAYRKTGSSRFMHVSVKLDDSTDYKSNYGECVSFYQYGTLSHCSLGSIDRLSKEILRKICGARQEPLSEQLIDHNYNLLSEKITTTAMEIHRMVQEDGVKANKAAFEKRISSQELLSDLMNANPYNNTEYYAVELKSKLFLYLEDRIEQSMPGLADVAHIKAKPLFDYVRLADTNELIALCQLIKPSERFSTVQRADIRRYSELITSMTAIPRFTRLPHYVDANKSFYLPTALDIPFPQDEIGCISDLEEEMSSNSNLLDLLFEYNNLITSRSSKSFRLDTKYTSSDDLGNDSTRNRIDSNYTKSLCLSIITKTDAEEQLK